MKFASWLSLPAIKRPSLLKALFASPTLSVSERVHPLKTSVSFLWVKLILSVSFLVLVVLFSRNFLNTEHYFQVVLISPIIYLLTESLGSLGQLSAKLAGIDLSAIHDHPLKSRSLSDFWGRKWNRWVQDWLRDVTRMYRRHPNKKLILTFLISGLFHELMVNLPYYLKYGELFFGNMLLYFIIQGAGLLIEKRIGHSLSPLFRRIFLWSFILLPSPLFLNYPLKHFLGLHHG